MKILGKTQSQVDAEKARKEYREEIANAEEYLKSTDWYAIRQAETGKMIPEDVMAARMNARNKISDLKKQSII